ncbi:ubiquitin-like-specific protease 2 [Exaiptasia diaphana]|uniref:Ubiquitin-like protease family profile domain-containing protein n=1 Tax=Exaiptasia diaphana TaxID=2652724 RepID=A0A913YT48_EXADI|nr:ubiquitin-like-specific protease 2 [Exaiptasia diaphana]
MDSMNSSRSGKVTKFRATAVDYVQRFLKEEWKERFNKTFPAARLVYPLVPQQPNCYDCGVYVLKFAEYFIKSPFQSVPHSMDLKQWFTQQDVNNLRDQMLSTLSSL